MRYIEKLFLFLGTVSVAATLGACSSGHRYASPSPFAEEISQSDLDAAHARLNLMSERTPGEEIDAATRHQIEDAIVRHLLKIGRYPTETAYDAEVRSLRALAGRPVPTYLARVYIPWTASSTEMDFLLTERNGEWVVRKAST